MRVNYAIVFVSDLDRAVSFYRDILGLTLNFQSPGRAEFATDGATLALQETSAHGGVPADQGGPGRCQPVFQVHDLTEFHRRMVEQKVPCKQPPTEVFGTLVAHYADPDGLVFSVDQQRHEA